LFKDGILTLTTKSDQVILEGLISVKAALTAKSRHIHRLYIERNRRERKTQQLRQLAQAAGIKTEFLSRPQIDALASGTTHGGILALAGPRKFTALESLLPGQAAPFIVMLDGVEDPFSFGNAIRALYAAGADGLVVRPRNWTTAAATVARASAGASELIPTAVAEDPHRAATFFREKGLLIAATAKKRGATSIYEADLSSPLFVLIGGEKRGIQRSFLDQADILLQVPYGRRFPQSLGTASTAAIIAFEVMRQRGHQQKSPL
jgi:23S rRNA (guanosine2251-2'-O)-methyltransferase